MKKLLVFLMFFLMSTNVFAESTTLYFRNDEVLSDTNTSSQDWKYSTAYAGYPLNWNADIYIVHEDTSTTLIGNNILLININIGNQISSVTEMSGTFDCPSTSMVATDKLRIVLKSTAAGQETFNSGILGWTGLSSATWTFYIWGRAYSAAEEEYQEWFYGSAARNTRVDNITYELKSNNPQMLL